MSVRFAIRTLTGRPVCQPTVILGRRQDRTRGCTVHVLGLPSGEARVPFDNADSVEELANDLLKAAAYMRKEN
ncbi:hypothetical protein [Micromonospora sp. NPDC049240]|uniref:hypothetical protein n=1 Tax=Micromonospora sp. NPDC049240 TaxID=3155151 RepID=UPI0033EF419F